MTEIAAPLAPSPNTPRATIAPPPPERWMAVKLADRSVAYDFGDKKGIWPFRKPDYTWSHDRVTTGAEPQPAGASYAEALEAATKLVYKGYKYQGYDFHPAHAVLEDTTAGAFYVAKLQSGRSSFSGNGPDGTIKFESITSRHPELRAVVGVEKTWEFERPGHKITADARPNR